MMSVFKYIFIPLMIIGLYGCGIGSLPTDKADYAGTWSSPNVSLHISTAAKVNYRKVEGGTTTTINAPIQKFTGNSFEVGALGVTTVFVVSKTPHKEGGQWTMTVDGIKLIKQAEW